MTDLPGWVVDAGWVAAHRDHVVLADLRWYLDGRPGRAAYEAGHIPGAIYVDLDEHLCAPVKGGSAGRHPLPSPEHFAASLGSLGLGPDASVVAYDDAGGSTAGRLVVMLRMLGRPAALLDGGLAAWSGPLRVGAGTALPPVAVTAEPWPADRLPAAEEVASLIAAGGTVLDARAPERYRGEVEPIDSRPGHVPGARNAPWAAVLDPVSSAFLPVAELRAHFERLGVQPGTDPVVYCGSGVSACADLIALEHAGLGSGRLFVASWSGWASDPARPAAVGSTP